MAKATHKNGLGRGLADLFAEERIPAEQEENGGVAALPMERIEPNRGQPRKVFDEDALRRLADSIRTHGVVTPITVRRRPNGYYQIIAGERRWRAARDAGLTDIPAIVLEATDEQVMEIALIENLQRQDLNPLEEAEGYDILIREYGMTQDKVADRVGKSRSAVANALRLLSLSGDARALVEQGKLSGGHARAVLAIRDEAQRDEAAKRMETLSVRQAESLAKRLNKTEPVSLPEKQAEVDYLAELERKLEGTLGRRVRIETGKTHGMLSLEFYGNEDLERLSEALASMQM